MGEVMQKKMNVNPLIKERINLIQKGIVPEGYKETQVGIIPEDWEVKKLKSVAPLQRGFDLPASEVEKGDIPICYSNGIIRYHSEYKVKAPGVVTGRSGTIGKVFFIKRNFWPHNTTLWVTDFKGNHEKFIYYLYSGFKLERQLAGTGVPTLNRNDIHIQSVAVPKSKNEQQKIADILSTWDRAIELKESLIEEKQEQKRGLMRRIFSQIDKSTFVGNLIKESKVTEESPAVERLLTVRLHLEGVFKRELRGNETVGATTLYKRKSGQFIYGKQNFHNGALGIVPDELDGFLSSSDIPSFDFELDEVNPLYFYYYWSKESNYRRLVAFTTGTGSRRLNPKEFYKIKMKLPSLEEQRKIANLLSTADREISLLKQELEQLKQQKKGLMQLLLTGIVRVGEVE